MMPEPSLAKTQQRHCLSVGQCQTLFQRDNHPNTQPLQQGGPALTAVNFLFYLSLLNSLSSRVPLTVCSTPAGRRLRLFHFLFEMLQDPSMAHCLSWAPAPAGVFSFSSRNKDQVAVLWGQRKGNKRPMTYQKMSRALRNYARSGHIFKVKKKLTYQFSRDTLISLQKGHGGDP
ncbi:transcription factor Spi-C [Xiphophorus hellerii]|uniref:transcription factor Spi-C n=1 Tax=Xiphophorus hellerii TaxID=8084 RepID=UPI0013B3E3E1|nr:transcription factor Spi-C-like [Xiphophorus hellerii]